MSDDNFPEPKGKTVSREAIPMFVTVFQVQANNSKIPSEKDFRHINEIPDYVEVEWDYNAQLQGWVLRAKWDEIDRN